MHNIKDLTNSRINFRSEQKEENKQCWSSLYKFPKSSSTLQNKKKETTYCDNCPSSSIPTSALTKNIKKISIVCNCWDNTNYVMIT